MLKDTTMEMSIVRIFLQICSADVDEDSIHTCTSRTGQLKNLVAETPSYGIVAHEQMCDYVTTTANRHTNRC